MDFSSFNGYNVKDIVARTRIAWLEELLATQLFTNTTLKTSDNLNTTMLPPSDIGTPSFSNDGITFSDPICLYQSVNYSDVQGKKVKLHFDKITNTNGINPENSYNHVLTVYCGSGSNWGDGISSANLGTLEFTCNNVNENIEIIVEIPVFENMSDFYIGITSQNISLGSGEETTITGMKLYVYR